MCDVRCAIIHKKHHNVKLLCKKFLQLRNIIHSRGQFKKFTCIINLRFYTYFYHAFQKEEFFFMRIKFSRALLISIMLSFSASSFAATPSIIMNGEAHVGEQVVLSVENSGIPSGGSVAWSVSPTTGQNPDRIQLRSGGRECAFTPLDVQPVKVIASFIDRDGNEISSREVLVTPKEFQVNIAVVIDRPLTLWDASRRVNYVLSPDILLEFSRQNTRLTHSTLQRCALFHVDSGRGYGTHEPGQRRHLHTPGQCRRK